MNKYFYPIYKMKLKPWIKYWLIKRSSVKPVTGTYTLASGQSPLTITKALKAPIRDLNLYGDCYQEQRESKNLWEFNSNNWYRNNSTSYVINSISSLSVTSSNNAYANTAFKLNLEDGTYTFSLGNVTNSNSSMTNKRMTLSSYTNGTRTVVQHIDMGTPKTITITNDENKQYVLEFWASYATALVNTATFTNIMVNLGSTALPYEPYGYKPSPTNPSEVQTITGNTGITISEVDGFHFNYKPIRLGSIELCKIGDYSDRIFKSEDNKWYLEKNIGKVVLNGTETITSGQYLTQGRFEIQNYTGLKGSAGNPNCLCNYFKASFDTNNGSIFVSGVNGRINMVDTTYSSNVDGFKTWLASNTPNVYYVLTEASVTEITNTNLLNDLESANQFETFKGTNEITFSDLSPNISFEYLKEDEV